MVHGRLWVVRQREQVDAAFKRAAAVDGLDPLSGDLAMHLVILTSGWLEQALFELARERCRSEQSGGPLLAFSLSHLDRTHNPSVDQIRSILARFSEAWARQFDDVVLTSERKVALESIVGLRHLIAHGQSHHAGSSVGRVKGYFDRCVELIDGVADILCPIPA